MNWRVWTTANWTWQISWGESRGEPSYQRSPLTCKSIEYQLTATNVLQCLGPGSWWRDWAWSHLGVVTGEDGHQEGGRGLARQSVESSVENCHKWCLIFSPNNQRTIVINIIRIARLSFPGGQVCNYFTFRPPDWKIQYFGGEMQLLVMQLRSERLYRPKYTGEMWVVIAQKLLITCSKTNNGLTIWFLSSVTMLRPVMGKMKGIFVYLGVCAKRGSNILLLCRVLSPLQAGLCQYQVIRLGARYKLWGQTDVCSHFRSSPPLRFITGDKCN